jgi:hypothetical protein
MHPVVRQRLEQRRLRLPNQDVRRLEQLALFALGRQRADERRLHVRDLELHVVELFTGNVRAVVVRGPYERGL